MTFKLKSGNKPGFKNMGSSPAKDMKTGSYEHSFESPAKHKKGEQHSHVDSAKKSHTQKEYEDKSEKYFDPKVVADAKASREKSSPTKQTKDTFADGSKKSKRDKFNDSETNKEISKASGVRREELLNQGFDPIEVDQMIKEGGATGTQPIDVPGGATPLPPRKKHKSKKPTSSKVGSAAGGVTGMITNSIIGAGFGKAGAKAIKLSKKKKSPGKWAQFIPMAISAISSMKKNKEEK